VSGIIVRPRSRILHGHDWVYSTEVQKIFGSPEAGDVVALRDGRDRLLGSAIFNPHSKIVARRFSHGRTALDQELLHRRIQRAWETRLKRGCDPLVCRVVWSESDGLPGVILDRYGRVGVLQTLTFAMDRWKNEIAQQAASILDLDAVIERNDAGIRTAEGLPESVGVLFGESSGELRVDLDGVTFDVSLLAGHKTGLYLDQREAYRTVASHAKDRRVLDAFSNQGGFALACAKAGAKSVLAVESSEACVAKIRSNAEANGLSIETMTADVFDYLPRAGHGQTTYGLIILDPPSFSKGRSSVHDALRGYQELHRHAARLLEPDGLLATFSCAHHVSRTDFLTSLRDGFQDSKKRAHVIASFSQPADHPVLLSMPETEYLKGFLVQAV